MLSLSINYDGQLGATINTSLQVGDLIYARSTHKQTGAEDLQVGQLDSTGTGTTNLVGVLREINRTTDANNAIVAELIVDNDMLTSFYTPVSGDFLMFSKYSQGDSGLLGYFARVRVINNSREKAEMFAISSEIIINSK